MATMAEIMGGINQGIGGLNSPLGQLGTQLLANSGPQQGNPGGGARLGQALAGMSEQQRQMALQQYRAQQIQLAEQQQAMALRQAQAKQEAQAKQQAAFQNPELLSQLSPIARTMSELGLGPDEILKANSADALQQHRAAQLQQQQAHFAQQQANRGAGGGGGQPPGPKMPTPRMTLDEPLGDGMIQRHKFSAETGSYVPFGKPFKQFAERKSSGMDDLLGEATSDDNVGAGPAVPGLPGANVKATPPPQGAELLMHGSGSNPMARPPSSAKGPATPSNSTAAGILAGVTPPDGQGVVAGILSGVTPKYNAPPKASAQGPATPRTAAEYAALPPGTQYIDPATGRVATKKAR